MLTPSTTTPTPVTQEDSASSPPSADKKASDLYDGTPYPANRRYPRQRMTAIGKLSNQVKSLEHDLNRCVGLCSHLTDSPVIG